MGLNNSEFPELCNWVKFPVTVTGNFTQLSITRHRVHYG